MFLILIAQLLNDKLDISEIFFDKYNSIYSHMQTNQWLNCNNI